MKEIILAVERLTVYHDNYAAVQDVSFSLTDGTNLAIIGPNGAGKSTLVQAILGILPHQKGKISIMGQPLNNQGLIASEIRQQIAYLPQNFLFDRRLPLTVEELVGLGWDELGFQWPWRGDRKRRYAVREALRKVGAIHLKDQLLSSLSGGETKRVLLAYCLVRPRRLLVLDEAPAGLDLRGETEFYQMLEGLKREHGWAILQISHDLERVRKSCDRVLCLNRRVLSQGAPEIVLSEDNLALVLTRAKDGYNNGN